AATGPPAAPRRGRLARCRGGRVCVGRVGRLGESDGRATRGGGAWALTGDRPSRRPDSSTRSTLWAAARPSGRPAARGAAECSGGRRSGSRRSETGREILAGAEAEGGFTTEAQGDPGERPRVSGPRLHNSATQPVVGSLGPLTRGRSPGVPLRALCGESSADDPGPRSTLVARLPPAGNSPP